MQLAGVCAVGARLLSQIRRADEGENGRRGIVRRNENFVARRPVYTVLGTESMQRLTGVAPRDWHIAVADYVRDHYRRVRLAPEV